MEVNAVGWDKLRQGARMAAEGYAVSNKGNRSRGAVLVRVGRQRFTGTVEGTDEVQEPRG